VEGTSPKIYLDNTHLLEVKRETNPTMAAFVEAKRLKGDERDLAAAVNKYEKMKKSEKNNSNAGGTGASARGGLQRDRRVYNAIRTPAAPFSVYLPTPSAPSTLGFQRQAPRPGVCFDCLEPGHRRGDAICKKKN
jgi:hypothetical protein